MKISVYLPLFVLVGLPMFACSDDKGSIVGDWLFCLNDDCSTFTKYGPWPAVGLSFKSDSSAYWLSSANNTLSSTDTYCERGFYKYYKWDGKMCLFYGEKEMNGNPYWGTTFELDNGTTSVSFGLAGKQYVKMKRIGPSRSSGTCDLQDGGVDTTSGLDGSVAP